MYVSVCKQSGVPAPCPGPPTLFVRSVSVKDASHHLGLSPLPLSQSFYIPKFQEMEGRQEGREGIKGSGALVNSITLVYRGSNATLGSRNLVLNPGSAT